MGKKAERKAERKAAESAIESQAAVQEDKPAKTAKVRKVKVRPATPEGLDPLAKLTKDLKEASLRLGDGEARFLVDFYYTIQQDRIRTAHQVRQLAKSGEPNAVIDYVRDQAELFEQQIQKALNAYSNSQEIGRWARSIVGVGPVIAAGLMANIQVREDSFQTVGKIWRYAGLDPTSKWLKGHKRPWNASLKRLSFILGGSFAKFQAHPNDFYGKVFRNRKNFEIHTNDEGRRVETCVATLAEKNYGEDTEALAWYSGCYPVGACGYWNGLERDARRAFPDDSGKRSAWLNSARETYLLSVKLPAGQGQPMLPPGRVNMRAQRYATKLFLSHWHAVAYELATGNPPRAPYVLTAEVQNRLNPLGNPALHEVIKPVNWPMIEGYNLGSVVPEPSLETLERADREC